MALLFCCLVRFGIVAGRTAEGIHQNSSKKKGEPAEPIPLSGFK